MYTLWTQIISRRKALSITATTTIGLFTAGCSSQGDDKQGNWCRIHAQKTPSSNHLRIQEIRENTTDDDMVVNYSINDSNNISKISLYANDSSKDENTNITDGLHTLRWKRKSHTWNGTLEVRVIGQNAEIIDKAKYDVKCGRGNAPWEEE